MLKFVRTALSAVLISLVGLAGACSAKPAVGSESVLITPAASVSAAATVQPKIGIVAEALMQSVGRNAAQAQPEEGFLLVLPDKVWAGEPFLVRAGGKGLRKVTVLWRGRTLSAEPGKDVRPVAEVSLLLSTLQKEKAEQRPIQVTLAWENGATETMKASIPIGIRDLPVQRLRVDPKFVTPPASMLEKIKQDREEMQAALRTGSPVKSWNVPLLRPVPGEVTSLYGLRRVFNGEERNPHRGIDFDAETGDPVKVCDDGTVVLVGDHYYSGKIVVVDHGLEVFSMYLHLSEPKAYVGQAVRRGDVVGLIGSTGRVTGPHLHFSLSVQGESVDAAPIMLGMEKITERAVSGSAPVKKKATGKSSKTKSGAKKSGAKAPATKK